VADPAHELTRRNTVFNIRIVTATAAATLAVGLALTGCSAGTADTASADGGTAQAGASTSHSAAPKPAVPGLNTPVKTGTFEYTALAAKAAGTTVGTAPLSQTAQGTYFEVTLKVANIGDSAQTFIVNDVKLEDANGKTYDADATAAIYAAPDAQTWVSAINPGNAVQGPVLFDIPSGVKPTQILVSDNAFGKGTPIRLG